MEVFVYSHPLITLIECIARILTGIFGTRISPPMCEGQKQKEYIFTLEIRPVFVRMMFVIGFDRCNPSYRSIPLLLYRIFDHLFNVCLDGSLIDTLKFAKLDVAVLMTLWFIIPVCWYMCGNMSVGSSFLTCRMVYFVKIIFYILILFVKWGSITMVLWVKGLLKPIYLRFYC